MKMVGHQSPSIAGGFGVCQNIAESFEVLIPVMFIAKYQTPIDTSDDDVVQRTRSVYARFAWHGVLLPPEDGVVDLFIFLWASLVSSSWIRLFLTSGDSSPILKSTLLI
jgi:hypothetical protein